MNPLRVSIAAAALLSALCWCQQAPSDWRTEARKYAEARQWDAAMEIVDRQRGIAPDDLEVLAWRARLLLWRGHPGDAEKAWKAVLALAPADPDNWLGLAGAYSQMGHSEQALRALDEAVRLDPGRADIHIARARAFLSLHNPAEAAREFRRALEIEPANKDAKEGLLSSRVPPRHELFIGTETDLFNLPGAFQQNEVTLLSQWTEHWKTGVGGGFYERGGVDAVKFSASLIATSSRWGALTVGGTAAHDAGIIPRNELVMDYDRGWKTTGIPAVRGFEYDYSQHWYWYSSARVVGNSGTAMVYLPREWTWLLRLTAARTEFSGLPRRWSPSGISKLGFPIVPSERHHLEGNVFFASGTENFAQIDQVGSFSSRTYGGGLRLQLTWLQDINGFEAYQMRSQGGSHTSFGVTYGLRF